MLISPTSVFPSPVYQVPINVKQYKIFLRFNFAQVGDKQTRMFCRVVSSLIFWKGMETVYVVYKAGGGEKVALCLVLTSRFVDHGDIQRTLGKNTHDRKGMYGWIGDTNFPS